MVNRDIQFELRGYAANEDNAFLTNTPEVVIETVRDLTTARSKAGRFARRINGPVDLAYAGDEPWEERYITTASPSIYHKSGFRFERLDG